MKKLWLVFNILIATLCHADLQVKVGQFAASTGGATTTVSGLGFTPKFIILSTHGKATNPESATSSFALGFSDGTHTWYGAVASDDAASTSNAGSSINSAKALAVLSNGTPTFATGGAINSVAFSSGQFVVTFNATPGSAYLIDYIVGGGSDITNVFVGNTTTPSSTTGLQHVTNVGFQGNFVISVISLATAVGTSTSAPLAIGVASSSSKRWSCNGVTVDAQTVSANVNSMSWCSASQFLTNQFTNNVQIFAADFSGFTGTGFDYTIGTSSASAYVYGYIVIQGAKWDVGMGTKPATATAQTVTGETFQPTLLGLFTSSPTALTTATSNQVNSFGASDGTNQFFANAIELDQINTVAKSSGSASAILLDRDGTNNPSATFTSFNSDGWTITWGATGSAREVGWFTAAPSNTGFALGGPFVILP